jgi:transporter family-2 protein
VTTPSTVRAVPAAGLALALAFLSGAGIAMQAYSNGRLGEELGSTELASVANNVVGLALLVAAGVGTGAFARGVRRVRMTPGRSRWWHFLGGLGGALFILTVTTAAPVVGVAALTVALVCGQTLGGLAVDAAGLSPAGRRPVTGLRVLGVGIALIAVVLAALGSEGDLRQACSPSLCWPEWRSPRSRQRTGSWLRAPMSPSWQGRSTSFSRARCL